MTKPIRRVGVVGSGVMGSGIAAHMANAGLEVLLLDIVPRDLSEEEKTNKKARDRIAAAFPDDAVMGEEQGGSVDGSRRTWIVDPIDGTRGFVRGVPLYSTLLALVDGDLG